MKVGRCCTSSTIASWLHAQPRLAGMAAVNAIRTTILRRGDRLFRRNPFATRVPILTDAGGSVSGREEPHEDLG